MMALHVYPRPHDGHVAVVEQLTKGALVGCLVHQGDMAWKIVAIEQTREGKGALVLRPLHHGNPPSPGPLDL